MKTITLRRTGDRPLQFEGEQITTTDTQQSISGRDSSRWHELTLYREKSGRYFMEIIYKTIWQGELDNHQVEECGTIEDVTQYLRDYDPCGFLTGFPPGRQFEGKQARLVRDITARYQSAVSDLLAGLPEVLA